MTATPPAALDRHAGVSAVRVRVAAVFWLSGAVFGCWVGRIPDVRQALGLAEAGLGIVLTAGPAGAFAATQLVPAWIARHGERRVLRIAACVFPLLLLAIAFAPHPLVLAAVLLAFGGASGVLNVAMNAHAASIEAWSGRPLMSGFHGWFSVGGLTGTLVAGAAARAGLAPATSLTASGLLLAAVGVTATFRLTAVARPADAPSPDDAPAGNDARRRALLLGVLALICLIAENTAANWGAVFLRDHRGAVPGLDVASYVALSSTMLVGRFAGNRVVSRLGPERTVRWAAGIGAAGMLLGLAVPSFAVTVLGFAALGAGLSVLVPVFFSTAGRLPGPAGVAVSRVGTLGYVGSLAGPPLIGGLAHWAGLSVAMALPSVLLVVVSCLAGATAVPPRRPGEAAELR